MNYSANRNVHTVSDSVSGIFKHPNQASFGLKNIFLFLTQKITKKRDLHINIKILS